MASRRELKTLITLAGRLDPSLEQAMLKAAGMGKDTSKKLTFWGTKLSLDLDKMGQASARWLKRAAVAGVAALGAGFTYLGKQGVELASDLEEVQNVVDVTFGQEGAKKIGSFADRALQSFGVTELEAKKFSGTFGALMKGAGVSGEALETMSQNLTALSGDMASFHNLSAEEAFEKLRSGISGETEPLKQLGINMSVANMEAFALSKGIGKSFSAMTQGEKTMLRYQYLMEKTADVQGDFARTSDSFSNQQKLLKANISQLAAEAAKGLLPVLTKGTKAMNDFLASSEGEELKTLIGRVMDASGKLAPLFSAVGKFTMLVLPRLVGWLEDVFGWLGKIGEGLGYFVDLLAKAQDLMAKNPQFQTNGYAGADMGGVIPGTSLPGYASGGFASRPSIFGEAGLEAAIPIRPGNPRSLGLLARTAQLLGVGGGVHLTYAPTIYGQAGSLDDLLRQQSQGMRDYLDDYFADQRRLAW